MSRKFNEHAKYEMLRKSVLRESPYSILCHMTRRQQSLSH
jgi:hypothetical protein